MKRQALVLILLLAACVPARSSPAVPTIPAPTTSTAQARPRTFGYQLQGFDRPGALEALEESRYDVLVVDDPGSLKDWGDFNTAAFVRRLHRRPGRVVLCYLDVGEAESYRAYWQAGWRVGSPGWIVAPDPDGWAENYPVQFWQPEWKAIARRMVTRAVEAGFDGMYLDWVEAYDFEPVARAHPEAREAMVEFVLDLARQARGLKPGFLVVPQNAAELVLHPDYLAGIDGLAVENIFYRGDPTNGRNDLPVDPSFRAERLPYMQRVVEAGKPVYTVDYATHPVHVAEAYEKNRALGFIPYVTTILLDRLSPNPPPGY
jgi:cysteinyl-tRNA synthetase